MKNEKIGKITLYLLQDLSTKKYRITFHSQCKGLEIGDTIELPSTIDKNFAQYKLLERHSLETDHVVRTRSQFSNLSKTDLTEYRKVLSYYKRLELLRKI